ncbi:energy-coupling factor ABC transporter ATP-binding protein [Anaerosinus massiliensis]|uniref:energy-coupling factor ABC transporter ATP-binding protein n=1 Tax=Massilibacillus massiliensis TaxID=1806837 RepID=UPI000A5D801C|nr:ABC transporter ATP-binding protein [Massilibacillus massiliensis]
MLKIQNMSYSYNKKEKVLDDISFQVMEGEILAIAGRNGSGKTTLTRIIMGIINADQGCMELYGKDIMKAKPADMASYIGYVFQNPDRQLFANSVFEEVAYAPQKLNFSQDEILENVKRSLEVTGLVGMEKHSPQMLSRGLKQRLSIASALAANPKFLILDEPTSGQDCRERTILLKLMRNFNLQGMTIILVTHDMDIIAEHAHRVVVLEKGELKFNGTPLKLFSDEKLTVELGLELPEAVRIGKEYDLGVCLTPREIYKKIEERKTMDV